MGRFNVRPGDGDSDWSIWDNAANGQRGSGLSERQARYQAAELELQYDAHGYRAPRNRAPHRPTRRGGGLATRRRTRRVGPRRLDRPRPPRRRPSRVDPRHRHTPRGSRLMAVTPGAVIRLENGPRAGAQFYEDDFLERVRAAQRMGLHHRRRPRLVTGLPATHCRRGGYGGV